MAMYFLYCIDSGQISAAAMATAGLGHLPPAATLITRGMLDGPDGRACLMVADGRCEPRRLRYAPAEQTWAKSAGGKYWLGFWNDQRPTAASLQRTAAMSGYKVTLGDGDEWIVPVLRQLDGGTGLEQAYAMTAEGLTCMPLPQHADLFARAGQLWADYQIQVTGEAGSIALADGQRFALAAEALALHYHLGADEITLLGLLTTVTMSKVLAALIDVPAFEAMLAALADAEKKNAPAETSGG
jgi:hypothetical protein